MVIYPARPIYGPPFNPLHHREVMRGWIAVAMSVIFLITICSFLLQAHYSDKPWKHMEAAMHDVLPAVTTVLGTVLGFYFGSLKR